MLLAGVACGAPVASAEDYSNIGGDMPWPDVPKIVEEPQPQTGSGGAARSPARRESSGSQSSTSNASTSSGGPQTGAASSADPVETTGSTERRQRRTERRSASRSEGDDILPPLPERREVSDIIQTAAPVSLSIPQATPEPEVQPKLVLDPAVVKLAGQMLIVSFEGTAPDEAWPKQVVAQIESGRVGGVIITGRNIQSPAQLSKLMNAMRRTKAAIPPFLAIEQEGGMAQALTFEKGFPNYPSAHDLGETNDPLIAYSVYQTLASEIGGYGFNLNLGPVVDLRLNQEHPAIAAKRRSYGPQPKHVASFAKAFRIAHHDAGLFTALKHFPGYGSASGAISDGPADIEAQWAEAEMEPYRELVGSTSADIVMMGHLAHSAFSDEPGLPASLSEKAVRRLREDVGFQGVVLSDDLEMEAIAKRFSLEDRVLRAIKAGNDMLLIGHGPAASPDLPDKVAALIGEAVASGALSRERLQASYDRIMALKQRLSPNSQAIASAKQDGEKPQSAAP